MSDLDKFKQYLAIDTNALDECLMQQPEVYHHVSERYVLAVGKRDTKKLDLEELTTELDITYRAKAAEAEEKFTETSLANRIKGQPKVKTLTREHLEAKQEADSWAALKESFQQRSHALRDLVALKLGERRDLALEGGAGQAKNALAEHNRQRAGELRRARRATS